MFQVHRRIIFYRFLKMGRVILRSFSLSPFIIFILGFCFSQIPKNPPPVATVLGTFLPDESSLQHYCSVQCWLIGAAVQSLYPHKRGSSFPSQGSVAYADAHPGCLGPLQTALSTPHSPVPWISCVCTLWCPSLPSVEPAGMVLEDNMDLGEPNRKFSALLPFGGNLKSEYMGCT